MRLFSVLALLSGLLAPAYPADSTFRVTGLVDSTRTETLSGTCTLFGKDSLRCDFQESILQPPSEFSVQVHAMFKKIPLDTIESGLKGPCEYPLPHGFAPDIDSLDCARKDLVKIKAKYVEWARRQANTCDMLQQRKTMVFHRESRHLWVSTDTSSSRSCGYVVKTYLKSERGGIQELYEIRTYRPPRSRSCPELEKFAKAPKRFKSSITGLDTKACESMRVQTR